MKVFTSNDFKGFWPVGTSAVVLAEDEDQAHELLRAELLKRGLKHGGGEFTLVEIKNMDDPIVILLQDGEY